MSTTDTTILTHHRVCNFCEAMCGVEVTLKHGEQNGEDNIVIKADNNDTFSKGSMCPKAPALSALHFDPSRLRHPVKRVGSDWVQISWDEAYTTVEDAIKGIRSRHGPDSIASYLGNPIVHNMGMMLFIKSLTEAIGSKNIYSATSMDQLPHHFAAHYMFGHEFRIPVPDVDRTDFMIIMGANPLASNGSIMTSAGIRDRLRSIKKRGGQFVVIDPRKTETANLATSHHFIKPGSDVYFLLAFLHVLYRDGLIDTGDLENHIIDYEKIGALADSVTPDAAEILTDIPAAAIVKLAHDYAAQSRAVLYGRMGLSTQRHGGLCHWLINTINIISGHFDTPGGMMFPTPAIELARGKPEQNRVGRWHSRVRGLPEFYGELPVSAMTEEITTEGEGQVRAFMTVCGNPVLSTPGGNRLDEALPSIEFMFSIDNYINETTRHANIILPTPSGLEVEHYDLIFNLISVSNNVKYSQAMLPPGDDRPNDWQVLKELISRLSPKGTGLLHRISTPRRIVNWGLMLGAYGKLSHPSRWISGLTLNKVIAAKHGISLGPLLPRVPEGLLTVDRKIHLAPQVFIDRLESLLQEGSSTSPAPSLGNDKDTSFQLIGRRHVSTNNSWMHQFKKLSRSRQVRCTAMISTFDATRLSITDGQDIKVRSVRGEIELPAEITDTVMPGVVCIPHGFGHTRSGTRIPNAEAKPGVSVNDITDHKHIDELTGNAAFSGLPVSIENIGLLTPIIPASGKPMLVLYGSRTGNAEFTAQELIKEAKNHKLVAQVSAMDDIDISDIVNAERILLLCSTYGEGEMPDNAQLLWEQLNTADAPNLANTWFSVLAFGDSNYETFCEAGKQWDNRLLELGAIRVADRVNCDVDYVDTAEGWMAAVLPDISSVGDQTCIEVLNTTGLSSTLPRYNRKNPMAAQLMSKQQLTKNGSSKETWHYVLSLAGMGIRYAPGDTLNIMPVNREDLVHELMSVLSIDDHAPSDGSSPSLHDRLLNELEIRTPSRALLELIAQNSPHADVRMLLSGKNRAAQDSYTWGKDIIDLLTLNPGVVTNEKSLLAVLQPMSPRSYSVSSSLNAHPDEVHLTVATVRYQSEARWHHGVSSGYLADIVNAGETINCYFAPNSGFSLPENDELPIIMVGPGTGLAPFRGFLQEREFRKARGKSWLFFGDRQATTDFLYKDELTNKLDNGVLNRLDLAFSRDQKKKLYVQHRMLEHAKEFYQWLELGAVFYVCGDAQHMGADVDAALHAIVKKQGGMSATEVSDYVAQLKRDKRYLRDVY